MLVLADSRPVRQLVTTSRNGAPRRAHVHDSSNARRPDDGHRRGCNTKLRALHYRSREVAEHTDNLLNLQIAVASHRTNVVMRVLTVMSVVFMPRTFIAGVYGMNFDAPEFHWRYGHLSIWTLIVVVLGGVLAWFQRRGWLR